MLHRKLALRGLAALLLFFGIAVGVPAGADDPPSNGAAPPDVTASRAPAFLETIERPAEFQAFLDATMEELEAEDPSLRKQAVHVALIDIPVDGPPRLAHVNGDERVYPASVVKFVYLMAAYAWRDQGLLEIDPAFDRQIRAMIYNSSNQATQKVMRRITETKAGPELPPDEYEEFVRKRLAVKNWLLLQGIDDLHAVHPTYDGGGDLHGRDVQFLKDERIEGGLEKSAGGYTNRQAMTAIDTAELLALLAEDLVFSPSTSAEVRERMRRDVRKQPYLQHRVAGGASHDREIEVFSKTGTWGPIHADAGILRHPSGHQLVVAAFLNGDPRYRGSFIANVTRRAVDEVFSATEPAKAEGR
jgi:beta-lactamase class A